MCRTRPSRDIDDGGTDRSTNWSGATPSHFISSVARWYSSHASSIARSPATYGGSVRSTLTRASWHAGVPPAGGIRVGVTPVLYSAPRGGAALRRRHRDGHLGR